MGTRIAFAGNGKDNIVGRPRFVRFTRILHGDANEAIEAAQKVIDAIGNIRPELKG